ncbi:hypothetical protein BD324DRAFT_616690 [Kockovaella imperatae]|uniref:Pre-rRNA-processing protein n=1 Tax=Kockovaella imperatae TaxID=4999 RepID=A0A1Y1UQ80_9TREE|nr:hypothetical protein BD324DRAFT_616690 [Kockovaella imperatae]ORX40183.1 hypothetical protein BD324DRAFT_616690 [Kockovaella imperatae]
MPKASKKPADFKKAKVKLGKGKQQASNATDTSFKARTIALPGQRLDRAFATPDEPVTAQGLTLDEVILRLRHPNAGVRRDALGGIKEILVVQPARDVGKVLRALGGVISDDDSGVRKTLLSLVGWYLSLQDESSLTPHIPLLLLHTSSGLSHIFPEIRLDACKLVHILLDHVPSHVVGSWPDCPAGSNNILEGLRLALGLQGDTGTTMSKTGSEGRLTALETLLAFLKFALRRTMDVQDPSSSFAGPAPIRNSSLQSLKGKEREVVGQVFSPGEYGYLAGTHNWAESSSSTFWDMSGLGVQGSGEDEQQITQLTTLYDQLAPLLVSTFMESAPVAFAPNRSNATSVDQTATSLCLVSASLTVHLAGAIRRDSGSDRAIRQTVFAFIRRMTPYFPFPSGRAAASTTLNGLTHGFEMSLAFASLVTLLLPATPVMTLPRSLASQGWVGRVQLINEAWSKIQLSSAVTSSGTGDISEEWAIGEVADWISTCLATTQDVTTAPLSSAAFRALLPIISDLIILRQKRVQTEDLSVPEPSSLVGEPFISHLLRSSSSSATRTAGDENLIDLVLIHEDLQSSVPFFLDLGSPLRHLIKIWLESLPKTLWEIGHKNDTATTNILEFLLRIGLRGRESFVAPYSLVPHTIFQEVSAKLASFFHISHPTRGHIAGPWIRLPNAWTRKLALDVARVWTPYEADLGRAVDLAVKGTDWERYWRK